MKKLIITLGLIGCTLASALAQGTINPLNGLLTRVQICMAAGEYRNAFASDGLRFSIWFGPAGGEPTTQVGGLATIGSTPGIITGWSTILALPGTEADEIVSLRIVGSSDLGIRLDTGVRQVTLAPTSGPGTIIWQTATGTHSDRFLPLIAECPEPSTLALGALAGAFLVVRVRKSTQAN